MSRVGENIKQAREKSGMTAKVLAKKLGVAEKYINEVEMGRKVVPESFIDRAAKILNADLNDISMVVTDKDLMEEKKTFRELPKKKLEFGQMHFHQYLDLYQYMTIHYILKKDPGKCQFTQTK